MSRLVSRILLSIFLFPLGAIFYGLVAAFSEMMLRGSGISGSSRDVTMFLVSGVLTWAFVGVYWFLLWYSSIQWNARRIASSVLSFPAAILAGLILGFLAATILPVGGDASFGVFIGGMLTILLWLVSSVFIWRETAAERAQRVKATNRTAMICPTCGYNLTGLTASRCPECGSQFTLDELVALQPKAEVEIE